jgi:hypothetical protein
MMKRTRLWAWTLAAAMGLVATAAARGQCPADFDGDGELTVFDFLAFQNAFALGEPVADIDGDGTLTVFDFLAFQNAFAAGCPLEGVHAADLAARVLDEYPFADYARTFSVGVPIAVALDPSAVPAPVGMVDAYIVASRTATQWAADPSLQDARGAPQVVSFPGGPSVADNTVDLDRLDLLEADAGESIGVAYDVVIDANGNGVLDAGDIIDGLGGPDDPDGVGFWLFEDLTAPGPLATTRVDSYAVAFPGIPADRTLQRLTYPSDVATRSNVPVVIISHGNGHDYRWYDYMHDHFASYGWVVMSHQNNASVPGIDLVSETTLRHTDAFYGSLATIAGGVLGGRLDRANTTWIGHSRGGEGAAQAVRKLRDGLYTPQHYTLADLNLVSSIAPTNSIWTSDPGPVNYHVLAGSGDGDVTGTVGGALFQYFGPYERANLVPGARQRTSTYVIGADHNVFNCCGFRDYVGPPGLELGRAESQRVAKMVWLILLHDATGRTSAGMDMLQRNWASVQPAGVDPSAAVVQEYKAAFDNGKTIIDDFQTQPSTTVASSGAAVEFTVRDATEARLNDTDASFTWQPTDPMNGMTRAGHPIDHHRGIVFGFDGQAFYRYTLPDTPVYRDLRAYRWLSLRACQMSRHPATVELADELDFTITLRDGAGRTSSIGIAAATGRGLSQPFPRAGDGAGVGWQNQFETIRVPLADFTRDGVPLDLGNIEAIVFEFGAGSGSPTGRVAIDDVELLR